jgi:acyl-CoA reductase-like NAD-dependent aldehyde dehydrogenase
MAEGKYQLLIDGELVDGAAGTFECINPATGKVLANVPNADQVQTDAAVAAAKRSFPAWAATPFEKRKDVIRAVKARLQEHADEIIRLVVQEQGKPMVMAKGEFGMIMENLDQNANLEIPVDVYSETETHRVEVRRKPIGVVVGITPWNFPLFCSVQKWAPAIALGNTFVHKPSPFTPLSALFIAKLVSDVIPKGVFNVVAGSDKAAFNVGAYLTAHPDVNKVSFTGSGPTGKKIMHNCANDVKRVTLELGGNDAAIIREDVNVDEVAPKVLMGGMLNTGQICCAIKRVYVHQSIYDRFVEKIAEAAKDLDTKTGDGFAEGMVLGPLNNSMQYNRVIELVEDAKKHGAIVHSGGAPRGGDGYFYPPTILSNVQEGVRIVDEEQFGPVLPIMKYSDDEEALRRANATEYGLGGSVWSSDVDKANELGDRLVTGTVWINDHLTETGAPFGGFKQSGLGRELGKADIATFTEMQTIRLAKK